MSPAAEAKLEAVFRSKQRRSISDNKLAASGPGSAAEMGQSLLDSPLA
jgi:hypothetical protein